MNECATLLCVFLIHQIWGLSLFLLVSLVSLSVSAVFVYVALPRLSQASASPPGQSQLAPHPHSQFPGVSWPGRRGSPTLRPEALAGMGGLGLVAAL